MAALSGKVVLITGGAGGFGKAFAKRFLTLGYKVCLCDMNIEAGQEAEQTFSSEFGEDKIKFTFCDVTSDTSFRDAFKTCIEAFGYVDILINNAGVHGGSDFKHAIDINLCGTIRGTEIAMEYMRKDKGNKGGRVINIGSIAGLLDIPMGPFYSATKSGIIHYSRVLGHPFHLNYSGVVVQCLCPSLVDTPFIETKQFYNVHCKAALKKKIASMPLLKTNEIADALIKLIEDNKPGGVLVVEKDKDSYYLDPPISA